MLYGGVQHNPPSRFLSDVDSKQESDYGSGLFGSALGAFGQVAQQNEYDQSPVYNDAGVDIPTLVPGDSVMHQVFGVGKVVAVDGESATIAFNTKGKKTLNLSFAPLQKL